VLSFAEAWAMISSAPARVMGLRDRGRIVPGARADLVIFDPVEGRVRATFAGGRAVFLSGAIAAAALG
jgi:alpha-D-ribose 1-methylphosphonate 5-triphosphate diphosphatase